MENKNCDAEQRLGKCRQKDPVPFIRECGAWSQMGINEV